MYKIHTVICICSSCCLITKSYLTLSGTMDCSSPDSSVHGIFQERILDWVAISFSRGSSWPRDQTHVSYIGRQTLPLSHQKSLYCVFSSAQFSSVAQSCMTLCNPMNCSTPGLTVHHQLQSPPKPMSIEPNDVIQPSHPLLSPSPPALSLSQHQGLF